MPRGDLRGHQGLGPLEAIVENRCRQLIGDGQVIRQQRGENEPPVSVLGDLSHDTEKTLHPGFAAGKQKQHPHPCGDGILIAIVETHFAGQAVALLVGKHRLVAVVEFNQVVKRRLSLRLQTKSTIGPGVFTIERKPQRVLGVEVGERNTRAMSGNGRGDDEVGQVLRMLLQRHRNRIEKRSPRQRSRRTVEHPVASRRELVVVRRCKAGAGVGPASHPACIAQALQAATEQTIVGERLPECSAILQKPDGGKRRAAQGGCDLAISLSPYGAGRMDCHLGALSYSVHRVFARNLACMNRQRKGWVNVEPLIEQVSIEQAARYYGIALQLERTTGEVRTRCFLNCGKTQETSDRAMAIDMDRKRFRCHHYGCTAGGGLLDLMFRMKHGQEPTGGKLRGDEFKEIVGDLQAIVGGAEPLLSAANQQQEPAPAKAKEVTTNVPLKDSENEAARNLVTLDDMLVVEAAEMSPKASQYSRKHALTADVCRQARCGYMPSNAKSSLRGTWVYGVFDEQGDALAWVGRDLLYEEKYGKWVAGGKVGREPNKFRFPKGFHRGLELYGQDRLADVEPGQLRETGLLVVEGFNDVLRMKELGAVALGVMSNTITAEQAAKLAGHAQEKAAGRVTLLFDNDIEGENGAKQALWILAQHDINLRLAWSRSMHGGEYTNKQAEDLDNDSWQQLRGYLAAGT